MPDPNSNDVIDMEIIASLRELGGDEDPGLVCELIDLYLSDAPARISEIEDALERDDFELLERATHTLKSASANIGATKLSAMCAELETMARSHAVDDPIARREGSRRTFTAVENALIALKS